MEQVGDEFKMRKLLLFLVFLFVIVFSSFVSGQTIVGPLGGLRIQVCGAMDQEGSDNSYVDPCSGTYPASCPSDRLDCDDDTNEAAIAGPSQWAGHRINVSNSSITNCDTIIGVDLCYEWWSTAGSLANCAILVDAHGGVSYQPTNLTCPGSSANPGIGLCQNVTALEVWSCTNFFSG